MPVFVSFLGNACSKQTPASSRNQYIEESRGPIEFAVCWMDEYDGENVQRALKMAQEEINANGKIRGRELIIRYYDDQGDVTRSRLLAQEIVENPKMLAVIGHFYSFITLPNAATYEYNDLLLMNPSSLSPQINAKGYENVFTIIPNAHEYGKVLEDYATQKGYQDILVYYINDVYGLGVSNAFEHQASMSSINIAFRGAFNRNSYRTLRAYVKDMNKFNFDAILIVGEPPDAAEFVRLIRENGFTQPIINDGALMSEDLFEIAGNHADGLVLTTPFFAGKPDAYAQDFTNKFQERYGEPPSAQAALVYDSIHILAYAANQVDVLHVDSISEYLKNIDEWMGATGDVRFNDAGVAQGKNLIVVEARDGSFHFRYTLENED